MFVSPNRDLLAGCNTYQPKGVCPLIAPLLLLRDWMGSRRSNTYRRGKPRLRPAMVLHRVHSAVYEWIATQYAPYRHRSAAEDPEPLHRFDRVFRAGWNVTAGGWQHRRDQPLVRAQNVDGQLL